jgi:transcriptional regulator with PAS, ATPase and Fis domain
MRTVGKYSAEDELNCGGCGYDSCRDFARALLDHNAERMMCATYTRKLAQKKANALLRKMPSAVVIVNEDLKIIESNERFTRLFATNTGQSTDLEGSALGVVVPFSNLFKRVLETGKDIVGHDIRYQRSILNTSIFTVQQIAYLLGENAADSEITLNSIVSSFSPEEADDNDSAEKP